ncbi:hypothetical protein AAG607_08840 [Citromicrobium bathyomarinum]|uniref:hypothetical protein n=1 Tax=Sphingomonadales TaxID=204457 RepID=UPI000C6B8452|nr:hypothetical protein [Citromicrobium sp.]MBO79969.1 hypothetical protein [Citromicrobium sp.]|tara:strand:+ start:1346 stop:1924 length:579 start_codon:yes stop_codon:yes gene_type:complete
MDAGLLMWLAAVFALTGVAVLRMSWGRATRSTPLNLAGWGALLVGLALADRAAGEWGIAVTVLVIGAAALAALAVAACKPVNRGPRKAPRTAHRGANEIKPRSRSGLLTFTVAGPLALGASLLFALAIRALILFGGGAEADANVAVLATVPIAWPVLAFALLMMSRRADQFAWVLGIAALAAPFLMFQGTTV